MIIEQLRNLLFLGLLILIMVGINKTYPINPVCPDDFKDSNAKIASFSEWVKDFTEKYPNATNSDLSKARREFYVKNNCMTSLKRYDDYVAGNVDKETKQLIEMVIKEELKKAGQLP